MILILKYKSEIIYNDDLFKLSDYLMEDLYTIYRNDEYVLNIIIKLNRVIIQDVFVYNGSNELELTEEQYIVLKPIIENMIFI